MNTITLAELYNQQYPIILTSNGESRFLQENDDGLGFNLEDDNGRIKDLRLRKDLEYSVSPQGVITIRGKTYRILTDQKNQPSPKLTRNIVTAYLSKPNDESDLTPDDRIHIFKTILAGSSDLSLDLFKDVCSEYDVDFNQLNKNNDYDFYRFASLVKDLIIHKNNMSIPYDIEHEIISAAYARFQYQDIHQDINTTPYDEQVNFIQSDSGLMLALINANENAASPTVLVAPTVPTNPVFETKTITWEQLTQVVDVLFDHDNSPFPLEDIKTSRSVTEPVEVLPDNRVIIRGQIYTPKCYVVPEVFSL